jgi:hypothetical protein
VLFVYPFLFYGAYFVLHLDWNQTPPFWKFANFIAFLIGLAGILEYRQPIRGYFITADGKHGVFVVEDENKAQEFERFMAELRASL